MAEEPVMKSLVLNPRGLAFIVATRAMLAAGVGLLVADLLPPQRRRRIGAALVTAGAATTLPAVMTVMRGARRARASRIAQDPRLRGISRFPRKGDDISQPEPAEWLFEEPY
jgi:hypothetical protein